jgi:DNA repair photolyase
VFVGIARLAAESPLLEAKRAVEYFELPTRRFIGRCSNPQMPFHWTLNPYRGCEFGCKYCYARYTHEFMELRDPADFERLIYAKQWDAPKFRHELARIPRRDAIAIGTATDPYQPAERRFGVTRKIMEEFAKQRGRQLGIVTKSDLVLRDLELLKTIARANVLFVNLTITTMDAELARIIEPLAPRPELRMNAVATLAAAGIKAGVLPNPILPYLTDSEESLETLAAAAVKAGASAMGGRLVFLKPCSQQVFFPFLEERFPELLPRYRALFASGAFLKGDYARRIEERLLAIKQRHHLSSGWVEYAPELWEGEPQLELFDPDNSAT